MDELLLRHLRRQTSREEDAAVAAWLEDSPDRERELAELRRLVEAGHVADRRIDPGDAPSPEDVIWRAEARVGRLQERGVARLGRRLRPRRPWLRWSDSLAAAAVVVVFLGVWQAVVRSGNSAAPSIHQFASTDPGETEIVRLADGSVIRLGPDSWFTASWRTEIPEGAAREVAFHGEAFFAVAGDPARPFRIATDAGTAEVLGTRFHLAADEEDLSVAVVEGQVALAGPDHEVQVGAGQATRLLRGQPQDVVAAPPIETVAAWLDDFLIFHDTPLSLAMEEVEARYGTDVVVNDPALLGRTLTMWFESKSLEEVMTVVCSVVDARCSVGEGVVRMESGAAGDGS